MTEREFKEAVAFGREQPGVEFKGPGARTDRAFLAKVVRAILGMVNRQDGGRVIVGVSENEETLEETGLTEPQARTWSYDDLAASVSVYADPEVQFHSGTVEVGDNQFVWIEVREFEDAPVLCKKAYEPTLRAGACYIRGRGKVETREVVDHFEMRELLDRAIEKGTRKLLQKMYRVGALTSGTVTEMPTDEDLFNEQIGDLR